MWYFNQRLECSEVITEMPHYFDNSTFLGPVTISVRDIVNGVVSVLLTILPNLLLIFIFRNSSNLHEDDTDGIGVDDIEVCDISVTLCY